MAVFPASVLVAIAWGPAYAAAFSAVAVVALLYSTSKKRDMWHLAGGTLVCAIGALTVVYANYLILWSGSAGSFGTAVVLGLVGAQSFNRGREIRRAAQLSLSRLRRYRQERGLLAHVAAPGDLPAGRRFAKFSKTTLAGAAACGIGWSSVLVAVLALRDLLTKGDNPWWGPFAVVILLIIGVALTSMGNSILRFGVQYFDKVISAPDDLTPGKYVLYLRSFEDDHRLMRPHRIPLVGGWLTGWISLGDSQEERIGAALSWAAPLVGVGAPGERVPRPGARRMYLPYDWKDSIRTLMRGAALVVIVLGDGKGIRWETRLAMRILPPERLLLLVPMGERSYEEFRAIAAGWAPVALPAYERSRAPTSRVRGLIYFKPPGRTAEFVALHRPSLLEDQLIGSLDRAMWPAMVQLTDYELRTGRTYG